MKLILAHLDQIWENRASNRLKIESTLVLAKEHGASLAVFPEMTMIGFSMNTAISCDSPIHGDKEYLSEMAKSFGIAIIAGIVQKNDKGYFQNQACFFDENGTSLMEYGKTHVFSFGGEVGTHTPGQINRSFDWSQTSWGLGVCYDLRFANHALHLARQGAKTLVYIANWPESRKDHWLTLLKARAIESQCNVIGVDRIGVDGAGLQYGTSMTAAFAPSGEQYILERLNVENSIMDLDCAAADSFRSKFNSIEDQRWDLYAEWIDAKR